MPSQQLAMLGSQAYIIHGRFTLIQINFRM